MSPTPDGREEFYVGYQRRMPRRLGRFVALVVVLLVVGAGVLAYGVPALHDPYAFGRSDFRDLRDFDGFLQTEPVPHLVVVRPGETGNQAFSRYILIGRGKSGPKIDLEGLSGKYVRVHGSLVYRDSETLISVRKAQAVPPPSSAPTATPMLGEGVGSFTLRGEIIDSKCYFGTMRPGNTAVHRCCAIRCIDGGIPPVFLTRDEQGNPMSFVLLSSDGSKVNRSVRRLIAQPIEISGEVLRLDNLFILKADPETYRRL